MDSEDVYERMRKREAMAKDLFMQYDSNGDGVLDFEEMVHMVLDLLPSYTPDEGRRIMRREFLALDRDGSENIDFPEFVSYYNKMLSYQSGSSHAFHEGGAATDFWSSDSSLGGHNDHARVLKRLHQRKKLDDAEYERAMYMLESKFYILDLKVALATYKRAETTLPLKRLLKNAKQEVDKQRKLASKFWTMSQGEIENGRSKADQWQAMGVITFDEYLQLRDLLDRRLMMTEIKAVMDTDDTDLLKKVLQNAKDEEMRNMEEQSNSHTQLMSNLTPLTSSSHSTSLYSSSSAPAFHSSYNESENRKSYLPDIDKVGVGDRTFQLSNSVVDHDMLGPKVVPTLSHKTMTKHEYLTFCKNVNMFMGEDEDVVFDDDVIQKLTRVIDGLVAAGFLTVGLGNKAKEFIMKGDRYIVYAIYQYDDKPGALTSYLTYKQSEDDKIKKEVKGIRKNIARRKSIDAFMQERKDVLTLARRQYADDIKRIQDEKKAAAEKEKREAAEREELANKKQKELNNKNKRLESSKPRWLLLYEAKFSSYNDLLYDDSNSQIAKLVSSVQASSGGSTLPLIDSK